MSIFTQVIEYEKNKISGPINIDTTHLIINSYNNSTEKLKYMTNIISIVFGTYFNKQVDNLPIYLLNLTFGIKFNKAVDKLPMHLLNITFGNDFNQTVNKLPTSLLNITFGVHFNNDVQLFQTRLHTLTFTSQIHSTKIKHLPKLIKCVRLFYLRDNKINNLSCCIEKIIFENPMYLYKYEIFKNNPFGLKNLYYKKVYKYQKINKNPYIKQKLPYGCTIIYG